MQVKLNLFIYLIFNLITIYLYGFILDLLSMTEWKEI